MKPFTKSTGWFRSRFLPRIRKGFRKGEPLTLAGVWILCTSCSFNNSFQDGCLGNIRITVPDINKAGARKHRRAKRSPSRASSQDKDKANPRPKLLPQHASDKALAAASAQPVDQGARPSLAQRASTAAMKLMRMNWSKWSKMIPKEKGKTPLRVPAPPKAPSLPEPPKHYLGINTWSETQRQHVPGIVRQFFWLPLLPSVAAGQTERPKVPTLRNGESLENWRERPDRIKLCFHTEDPNAGWTRFHMPRNTYQAKAHCRAGYPLGSGKHWYLVDDTFAATATPCRVFFSPGRAHLVAQCGVTIYRSSIRKAARCLQVGDGKHCDLPHATLAKMPTYHAQPVEWRPEQAK